MGRRGRQESWEVDGVLPPDGSDGRRSGGQLEIALPSAKSALRRRGGVPRVHGGHCEQFVEGQQIWDGLPRGVGSGVVDVRRGD